VPDRSAFITVLIRYLIEVAFYQDNIEQVKAMIVADGNLDANGEKIVGTILDKFASYMRHPQQVDMIAAALFYLFYVGDVGVQEAINFYEYVNTDLRTFYEDISAAVSPVLAEYKRKADWFLELIRPIVVVVDPPVECGCE
jgi:hypothetical protein